MSVRSDRSGASPGTHIGGSMGVRLAPLPAKALMEADEKQSGWYHGYQNDIRPCRLCDFYMTCRFFYLFFGGKE